MYRVRSLMALLGLALVFVAEIPPSSGVGATAAQLALQTPPLADDIGLPTAFGELIDRQLDASIADEADATRKAWDRQLKSFYAARAGVPVWVSEKGWTARANAALREFADAASWGLDVEDFKAPLLDLGSFSDKQLVEAEVALSRLVVKYASHARGGRIVPSSLSLWLDRTPDEVFATAVMIEIISATDAGAALRGMHPQSASFDLLRRAYNQMRAEIENPRQLDPADVIPYGAELKVGQWHPDVMILRRRLNVPAVAGYESQFDEKLANALDDHLGEARVRVKWGRINDRAREYFNRPPKPPSENDVKRLRANMERWRWLPRDLGKMHIWNNLPEFMTRIVKDGTVMHEERIIIGEPGTQTPVFSDAMRQIVFQPEWGVPPSIKVNDLLPKLQAGDYDVLDRRDMRILGISGKELKPGRFNWDKVDIRDIGIYQRSGSANPLGRVKFLFPNKYHVYMHDTNNPALFKHADRTFSHGCIRVRDPEKFAEIILAADKDWGEEDVENHLNDRKKPNNKIELETAIPVHNVYFTLVPGEGGNLVQLADIYDHDKRIIQALDGVDPKKIAANDPARHQQAELEEAAPPQVRRANAARAAAVEEQD